MKPASLRLSLAVSLSLFCPLALAHPGHNGAIAGGMLHPLSGLDHLLAMLGVGLWSAQQNGRARCLIPASFVILMALSAWIAAHGHSPSFIEQGIAASVLLLGLLISFAARVSVVAGASIVSAFAVVHGAAHGAELPATFSGWLYGAGFLTTTILLHVAGFFTGSLFNAHGRLALLGGSGIATYGGVLTLQAFH